MKWFLRWYHGDKWVQRNAALKNETEKRVIDSSCSPDWKEKDQNKSNIEVTIPAEEGDIQKMNIRLSENRLSNKGVR